MSANPDPLALAPWFGSVLEAAAITKGRRVLVLGPSVEQCTAVLAAVGPSGAVTVVQPDPVVAAAIDGLPETTLGVLTQEMRGNERLGMHDAAIHCAGSQGCPNLAVWSGLAARNLRPGGRMVLDLPARPHVEVLADALRSAAVPDADIARLDGPTRAELEKNITRLGLRSAEIHELAHLITFESPRDAAVLAVAMCGADPARAEFTETVARILTSRYATVAAFEIPFHRLRMQAMR